MKKFVFLLTIGFIIGFVILSYQNHILEQELERVKTQQIQMDSLIHQNKHSIQTIQTHWDECSFISRHDVGIGYDNYFQYQPRKGAGQ